MAKSQSKLATYRAKRDFSRTEEPSGETLVQSADYPRFVIQKHDATRLHYDLRLEMDGVFKSWAVTRGPSLDPKDKRLAVEVEDHPLDYGDFEGTIPKGEYGGGTVMLWDRGFWLPDGDKPAEQALADGDLKIVLAGSKLNGSWVLVRMKNDRSGGKRTNWLLIKHRDEFARAGDKDALLKEDRSVASGRTMAEIAAGKGRSPKPFILARRAAFKPNAIWHSDGDSDDRILGVKISSPEKELWPATKGEPAATKRDLARYLEAVASWMLPHIEGRPCSVVRAPDGLSGETFFQRHAMRGTSEHVVLARIEDDRKPYIQIDSAEGLIAMAQIAALEFHPWNCAPHEPTVPGRLVFDLDPGPGVTYDDVVGAAQELRRRLEHIGLVPFCKTTGGKGLHVVVPLKPKRKSTLGWPDAKMFAHAVCERMADDTPGRYVTTMRKNLRRGKIFLDYLRNDRMATAVAPLSPRARPGAPVAMPITWAQARRGLDPMRFTLRTVPRLLATSKAWEGYDKAARPLEDAIRKLLDGAR